MKFTIFKKTTILFLALALISFHAFPEVKLPKLVGNGMVLQRQAEINIWGWADAEEEIKIQFQNKTYSAKANEKGEWTVKMKNLEVGGPYEMKLSASNEIILKNILVGDVWVAGGQSNMQFPMNRLREKYKDDIANCTNDKIRFFNVPFAYSFEGPQDDVRTGNWVSTTPETVLQYSAVAYFFAKEIYAKYKIPIGVISSNVGGTPAEAWTSKEALKEFPHYYQEIQKNNDSTYIQRIENKNEQIKIDWFNEVNSKDLAYKSSAKAWKDGTLNTADWKTMQVPGFWTDYGLKKVNGAVWCMKEIELSEEFIKKTIRLKLGRIADMDSVFVNGTFVGSTTHQFAGRNYKIPQGVLKAGKNTIVIRILNQRGKGGFIKNTDYKLYSKEEKISLEGEWKYKLGAKTEAMARPVQLHRNPSVLYNAMIAPLLNYSIKGVIWYQGEANARAAEEYATLFPNMIKNWRKKWNQGDFPFLFVQLANFQKPVVRPRPSNWAMLRESQLKTLALKNTGMAVAIDIGEANDIHPLNKKDVGKRLAPAAFNKAYAEKNIVFSGPVYKSMEIKGNKIILSFDTFGSKLSVKGKELQEFAIAGKNKKFVWAKAEIKNDKVIVYSDEVKNPVAVRYAWANNPEKANLINEEGLPASPFRTDDWEK